MGHKGEPSKVGIATLVFAVAGFIAIAVLGSIAVAKIFHTDDDVDALLISPCATQTATTDCDDGIECTLDSAVGDLGCVHNNQKNGVACTNACFQDAGTTCQNGQCLGANCRGACNSTGDCPQNIEINGDVTAMNATSCDYNVCIYQFTFTDTAIYCGGDDSIVNQICEGLLLEGGTYTDCMDVDSFCTYNASTSTATVYCMYKFSCADPILTTIIISRKR